MQVSTNKTINNLFRAWEDYGNILKIGEDGVIVLKKALNRAPGSEQGLISSGRFRNLELAFEVNIQPGTCFIAKILQVDKYNQKTNSYHLMHENGTAYFARHDHIFKKFKLEENEWVKIRLVYKFKELSVYVGQRLIYKGQDGKLPGGYAFLGLKGGEVYLRNIEINNGSNHHPPFYRNSLEYELRHSFTGAFDPLISIVTTVYDRVQCLIDCIKSVKNLEFEQYEHLIVSDCPPAEILKEIESAIIGEDNGKIAFANLKRRFNNWGIAPAMLGLRLTRGRYVAFLSDDNGYMPDHISNLVEVLENNPQLGFAYSSCWYNGIGILNSSAPRPGRIDLGQPLFRRELFERYFPGDFPFQVFAWDWHMIDYLIKKGVRWKHVNKPTFIFRLARYPHLMAR